MHLSAILLSFIFSTASLTAPAANPDQKALSDSLILAPTARDRANILSDPSNFVFDFHNPPTESAVAKGNGGRTVRADRGTFPALIGTGVSMTVGFLGPCGFNTPHTHPRSTEMNIPVVGRLVTEFQSENNTPRIINEVNTYQLTIFPKGALHTEFNPDCTETVFVAGFGDEDPGVQQTAQAFFGLREDIVKATLGDALVSSALDLEKARSLLPANVALGVEECLKKCAKKGD